MQHGCTRTWKSDIETKQHVLLHDTFLEYMQDLYVWDEIDRIVRQLPRPQDRPRERIPLTHEITFHNVFFIQLCELCEMSCCNSCE